MGKKSTDRRRGLWIAAALLTAIATLAIILSPYGAKPGHDYKLIRTEITIDAPPEAVFEYPGNSASRFIGRSDRKPHGLPLHCFLKITGLHNSKKRKCTSPPIALPLSTKPTWTISNSW